MKKTLREALGLRPKFVIVVNRTRGGRQPWITLVSGRNGKKLMHSEGYSSFFEARDTADSISADTGWPIEERSA